MECITILANLWSIQINKSIDQHVPDKDEAVVRWMTQLSSGVVNPTLLDPVILEDSSVFSNFQSGNPDPIFATWKPDFFYKVVNVISRWDSA